MTDLWWVAADVCFFIALAAWIWVAARILSVDDGDDRAKNR